MEKALITGGAGFIGSNLAEMLLERDVDVKILDSMYLGTPENLEGLDVEIIEGSVMDMEKVREAVEGCDTVFHNAARSSAPMHKEDPAEGARINIEGFINVVEEAMDQDVEKVVYASTSSMYGSVEPPHKEDMGEKPTNRYSASKMARELYADVYAQKGLDITGIRYFSVYGPREKAKGRFANVISQFLWSMLDGESPKIFGDGEQTRDFTFVKDIARANILAAEKGEAGQYYNIGTETETSFNTVVEKLNEELGTDIEPEKVDNPIKNYVRRTRSDTSRAKEDLGYEPEYSFEEGLKETVEYYRDQN